MTVNDVPVDETNFHKKPTPEELDAKAEQALKDLENMEEKPDEESEDETPETPDEKEEPENPEVKPEEPEKPKKLADLPREEVEKKLKESSREALVLHARQKLVQDAIKKASTLGEPTEDDLRKEYDSWDDLSDFEKDMAKKNYVATQRLNAITSVAVDFEKQTEWDSKVDKFLDDPKTLADLPDLDGRQEEFKTFASKPSRVGLDFEDLTKAFLFDIDKEKKERPGKKGSMLPSGMASVRKSNPDDGKITIEDARKLRDQNYKKYVELLKAGKISTDI